MIFSKLQINQKKKEQKEGRGEGGMKERKEGRKKKRRKEEGKRNKERWKEGRTMKEEILVC